MTLLLVIILLLYSLDSFSLFVATPKDSCGIKIKLEPGDMLDHIFGIYTCTICNASFITYQELSEHTHTEDSNTLQEADIGNQIEKVEKKESKAQMLIQKALSQDKTQLDARALSIIRDTVECICDQRFSSEEELDRHLKLQHKSTTTLGTRYICPKCNAITCTGIAVFKNHIKTHTKEYSCTCVLCDSSFKNIADLNEHIKRCIIKADSSLSDVLVVPIRKQTKNRLKEIIYANLMNIISCTECACSKVFKSEKKLDAHADIMHYKSHAYICPQCKRKITKRLTAFKRHMRSHTEDKPYSCKLCNKSHKTKELLYAHILCDHEPAEVAPHIIEQFR